MPAGPCDCKMQSDDATVRGAVLRLQIELGILPIPGLHLAVAGFLHKAARSQQNVACAACEAMILVTAWQHFTLGPLWQSGAGCSSLHSSIRKSPLEPHDGWLLAPASCSSTFQGILRSRNTTKVLAERLLRYYMLNYYNVSKCKGLTRPCAALTSSCPCPLSQALPSWAQKTLEKHSSDPRHEKSLQQLERGQTGDKLWDAAQQQLADTGTHLLHARDRCRFIVRLYGCSLS